MQNKFIMNKNDFKIGQWVTSTYTNCGVKAIKFNGWDTKHPDCPKLTEAIDNYGKLVENYNDGGIWNSDYGLCLIPFDMTELQQYLPDGHPDKQVVIPTDLKEGNWYKITILNNFTHIVKIKKVTSKTITLDVGYYVFVAKKWQNVSGIVETFEITEITPQSIEDIQQYLPDEHPDKLKRKSINVCAVEMVVGEIYAGDWVVFEVNKCVGSLRRCNTEIWCKDMVLKVKNVKSIYLEFDFSELQRNLSKDWKITTTASNDKRLFRKAEPHEIPVLSSDKSLSLGGGSGMQYDSNFALKLGGQGQSVSEKPVYSVYIKDDKPKQKKEEPIRLNLTPRKNIKINLVV